MKDLLAGTFGVLIAIGFFAFGIFTLWAGWTGIEDRFGWGWGLAAILAALFIRFTLPISVGVFFYATDTLDWHWMFAVLLAAPGLVFMIPGLVVALFSVFKGRTA